MSSRLRTYTSSHLRTFPFSHLPTFSRLFFCSLCFLLFNPLALRGADPAPASGPTDTSIINFEETLYRMRAENYRHPKIDIIKPGFRPVGGKIADFAVAELNGRHHFYYIERRLTEGTPFYPGHEIYFGHASTADFLNWEVHDPVMLIRPGTWEDAHVWAPCILRRGNEYVMAYTGVNRHISQNIGLASSTDLFNWNRWDSNPISPCKGRPWAFWHEDRISSCRDPHLFEYDGRIGMIYTANTAQGASCIALATTKDLLTASDPQAWKDFETGKKSPTWTDEGPILTGPATGYEPRLTGGHPQGSLESASIIRKHGRWYLLVKAAIRNAGNRQWVFTCDDLAARGTDNANDNATDHPTDTPGRRLADRLKFDFNQRREFWPGATGIEFVAEKGDLALLATFAEGHIRFGVTDWSAKEPTARFVANEDELREWRPTRWARSRPALRP